MKLSKAQRVSAALFVSVALNLFALSWYVGQPAPGFKPPIDRVREQSSTWPAAQRTQVNEILARYQPKLDAQVAVMKASRKTLHDIMKQPDYDRKRADAQFERMQAELGKLQDISKVMILDVNDVLTPEQRAEFDPFPQKK
ncbi:MAG: periplasmic heavy metal sensor [Rickettsiales bacterium]